MRQCEYPTALPCPNKATHGGYCKEHTDLNVPFASTHKQYGREKMKVGYKYRVDGYDGLHLSECLVVFYPKEGYECTCDDWGPE